MVKIHELIACCDNEALKSKLCASVKFDIGDTSQLESLADLSNFAFFELPYPVCTFQVCKEDTKTHFIFLAIDHEDGQITFSLFLGSKGRWISFPVWLVIDKPCDGNNNQYGFSVCDVKTGQQLFRDSNGFLSCDLMSEEQMYFVFYLFEMARSIEVFSCSNVYTIEHKPSENLNKSRIKKKKIPFFSYHTLHINGQSTKQDTDKSGTHASPRLHLRRGHIRRLPDGRKIWVRHCLVGDKNKGFVTKDYSVDI